MVAWVALGWLLVSGVASAHPDSVHPSTASAVQRAIGIAEVVGDRLHRRGDDPAALVEWLRARPEVRAAAYVDDMVSFAARGAPSIGVPTRAWYRARAAGDPTRLRGRASAPAIGGAQVFVGQERGAGRERRTALFYKARLIHTLGPAAAREGDAGPGPDHTHRGGLLYSGPRAYDLWSDAHLAWVVAAFTGVRDYVGGIRAPQARALIRSLDGTADWKAVLATASDPCGDTLRATAAGLVTGLAGTYGDAFTAGKQGTEMYACWRDEVDSSGRSGACEELLASALQTWLGALGAYAADRALAKLVVAGVTLPAGAGTFVPMLAGLAVTSAADLAVNLVEDAVEPPAFDQAARGVGYSLAEAIGEVGNWVDMGQHDMINIAAYGVQVVAADPRRESGGSTMVEAITSGIEISIDNVPAFIEEAPKAFPGLLLDAIPFIVHVYQKPPLGIELAFGQAFLAPEAHAFGVGQQTARKFHHPGREGTERRPNLRDEVGAKAPPSPGGLPLGSRIH